MTFPEHVPHATARNDLQAATALPHPKRNLQILTAPHVHFHVVPAEFLKVPLIDHKQTARDHRRPNGRRRIALPGRPFAGAQVLPFEDQIPVETAAQIGRRPNVLERVHADHIDDRTHDARRVLGHPLQQRFQPVLVALAVAVQERKHVGGRDLGAVDARPHQAFALLVANHLDLVDLCQFETVFGWGCNECIQS